MSFLENLLLALALAMDAFAVSLSLAYQLKKVRLGQYFSFSFYFGFFQFVMPIIGYYATFFVGDSFIQYGPYVAFALLVFVGAKMIYESFQSEEKDEKEINILLLLGLAVATSIDALSVGVSFRFLDVAILSPSILIGIVCMLCTLFALWLGTLLSSKSSLGQRAEILGGCVLILIAVQILWKNS